MTKSISQLPWPWDEFPEDASTWQECVKQYRELVAPSPSIEAIGREAAERIADGHRSGEIGHAVKQSRDRAIFVERVAKIITDTLRATDLYREGVEDACKELGDLERNAVNFRRGFEAARDAAREICNHYERRHASGFRCNTGEYLADKIAALTNPTPDKE